MAAVKREIPLENSLVSLIYEGRIFLFGFLDFFIDRFGKV